MDRGKKNVRITDQELALLEVINSLGPCTSEKVHEAADTRFEYLYVMRSLHGLVEKGFLQRVIINQKQFYKTSRNYNYIKSFLNHLNS
ncbi:MAG: BlaI/MecI/CopY family transcriptional regulator [Chryseosolibacter sp.]